MCDLIKENFFNERQIEAIISGHKHFNEKIYERFNIKVSLNTYVSYYVKKNNYGSIRIKKSNPSLFKKVMDLEKIMVYSVIPGVEYPITVYPVDKFNFKKSKILPKFNMSKNRIEYDENTIKDMLNKGLITYRKYKKGKSK